MLQYLIIIRNVFIANKIHLKKEHIVLYTAVLEQKVWA